MGVLPRLATGLPATQPLPCKFFAQGFPCLLFTSLPLLGFVGKHSCYTNPFYYVILQASSTHLLPFYVFYSHELFAKSFGLPRPNYHIFTSYYYLGLLLHSLGFLGPLTLSLLLFILVGPAGRQSYHSNLLGLLYYFLFSFSSYCWVSPAVGPFVKSGHQHQSKCGSKLSNP